MPNNVISFPKAKVAPASEKKKRKGERKDGLIQVTLTVGRKPDGTRDRKSFYGVSRKEAETKRDAYLRDIEKGLDVRAENYTIREWGEHWLSTYKASVRYTTYEKYRDSLRRFSLMCGDIELKKIKQIDIQKFANSLASMSQSTIHSSRVTINQLFRAAMDNGITPIIPSSGVKWPAGTKGEHRALEQYERELIVAHWRAHRACFWPLLMLFTGMRRGEALALMWEDIDLDAGIIRVQESMHFEKNQPVDGATKTEAGTRVIPILSPLMEPLRELCRDSGHVCVSASDERVTNIAFRRGWQTCLNILTYAHNGLSAEASPGRRLDKIKKEMAEAHEKDKSKPEWKEIAFTPHDLRHTFSTILYDAGVDVKTAQALLGHRDPTVTMKIYTHLSESRKQTSLEALNSYLNIYK